MNVSVSPLLRSSHPGRLIPVDEVAYPGIMSRLANR